VVTRDRASLDVSIGFTNDSDISPEEEYALSVDDAMFGASLRDISLSVGATREVMNPPGTPSGGPWGDVWHWDSVEPPKLSVATVRFLSLSAPMSVRFDLAFDDGTALRGAATEEDEYVGDCIK
jgi:hypothetical protein